MNTWFERKSENQ